MEHNRYSGAPIYQQIVQDIRLRIASGRWPAQMRIPPVRELSVELGVNPNTAQRSLAELEREGLVYAEGTAGRYITPDTGRIRALRTQMAADHTAAYCRHMAALGYTPEETECCLSHYNEKGGAVCGPDRQANGDDESLSGQL